MNVNLKATRDVRTLKKYVIGLNSNTRKRERERVEKLNLLANHALASSHFIIDR